MLAPLSVANPAAYAMQKCSENKAARSGSRTATSAVVGSTGKTTVVFVGGVKLTETRDRNGTIIVTSAEYHGCKPDDEK